MKTIIKSALIFSVVVIMSGLGCKKEDLEKCQDEKVASWLNVRADLLQVDQVSGNAQFCYTAECNNVCIYSNAFPSITIIEKPGSQIAFVTAFIILPSSTPPDFYIDHYQNSWYNRDYTLNLRQSFSSNPGSFKIKLYIYIPATTESEALQKYDAYIDKIDIYAHYSPPL